ncbi:glutathione S-transferase family protein [Pseudoxanthomonas sp. PXM01]|uniref:glutathione S-transferase family protein n=1 Tax=Pseudoxanthomonas sp. PXM01 TaxID=2769295 RepID=UPI001786179E|nr:glutathione S-transferase family protein [Pseudoxanthomonas sp. PXM01]MBD9469653.1 glutathione S-transferase family protein [Pseudoxanthomonas sp. PXM01]
MQTSRDNHPPVLFYGVPSGCSFGSIVALEWLGLPYHLCRIEMPGVVSSDAYKRINAVGETPTLRTAAGDFISESIAILNHIGASDLDRGIAFAQGTPGFDRLNQMLAYLNTSLFDAYAPFWYTLEHELDPSDKKVLTDYGQAKVLKAHTDLEAMVGEKPWLLGEHRTLADAYFIGIARWNEYHQVVDRREYPNLQRIYDQLEADPAVVFAHAIERQQPPIGAVGLIGHIALEEVLEQVLSAK